MHSCHMWLPYRLCAHGFPWFIRSLRRRRLGENPQEWTVCTEARGLKARLCTRGGKDPARTHQRGDWHKYLEASAILVVKLSRCYSLAHGPPKGPLDRIFTLNRTSQS